LRPHDRIDIVPANYVGKAVVTIHQKDAPTHGIYHLSSGTGSQTFVELTEAIAKAGGMRRPLFWPWLGGAFSRSVNWAASRKGAVGHAGSLLKVFWPYLDWNTVFDNSRVVAELGEAPAKFSTYAAGLLKFSPAAYVENFASASPSSATTRELSNTVFQ